MAEAIHDREADTSEPVVRSLLHEQCPQWAGSPISQLDNSGTTNALWRVDTGPGRPDCVVRLPRTRDAERSILTELELLPALRSTDLAATVEIPQPVHRGRPGDTFPLCWMVLTWIDGDDAWTARDRLARSPMELVTDLADAIRKIAELEALPVPHREPGSRGGPLGPLLARLGGWLEDPQWQAGDLIDTVAVRRLAAESAEIEHEPVRIGFVHGDLIPGNLLTTGRRLSAIIDWGGAGRGDLAQDLCPAWAIFDGAARQAFRRELQIDDATWLRARAFELEHAVGGVLYYKPRRHLLGDVMARTLTGILSEI